MNAASAMREGENPGARLLSSAQREVDAALAIVLDRIDRAKRSDGPDGAHHAPARLLEAMRYAVLSPGKRLRPALVIGGARAAGLRTRDVLPAACAVEMVHAYSLVHDDLPALDNDALRRGQPTCHRAFGEATAILAGDALLTEALTLLSDGAPIQREAACARPRHRARATSELARAIGAAGMIGGQHDDLENRTPNRGQILSVHRRKTGRLIQASSTLGAIYGGASKRAIEALREFGADIGLAFQLIDDAIDGDGLARLDGTARAREEALQLTERGIARLDRFGAKARPLQELARAMVERTA